MDIIERSDVGLGVVYEQFMLNRLLERIVKEHNVKTVLEAPIFGMAGLTGINSMSLPELGTDVTLVDCDQNRLSETKEAWSLAKRRARFIFSQTPENLDFADSEFDLVYNFAALWHLKNPEKMLHEMTRLSSKIVLVCMPNPFNPMFQIKIRKLAGKLPPEHKWADMKRIERVLSDAGFDVLESGLIDIPPWPDTVVALKKIILGQKRANTWRWSMLDYYCGNAPLLKEKAESYSFIEDSKLPKPIKGLWAHHFYLVAKNRG